MPKTKVSKSEHKFLMKLASRGGRNRAKNLTAKRRREIAIKGAAVRWAKAREVTQVLQ